MFGASIEGLVGYGNRCVRFTPLPPRPRRWHSMRTGKISRLRVISRGERSWERSYSGGSLRGQRADDHCIDPAAVEAEVAQALPEGVEGRGGRSRRVGSACQHSHDCSPYIRRRSAAERSDWHAASFSRHVGTRWLWRDVPRVRCEKSIVVAELRKEQGVCYNLIDHTMFIRDTSRPVPGQTMFQRLGLANALKGCPLDFLDEGIDPLDDFAVCALPI